MSEPIQAAPAAANGGPAREAVLAAVYREYLDAVLAGRRLDAFAAVDRAATAGLPLRTLYLEVFQPALREVGKRWQENRLSVAEEHLATAITHTAMLRLYTAAELPESTGPLLIAACAETERHEIGLRMLCDFLDLDGWETVFLGAAVPVADLIAMVGARQPQVVALSASIVPHLPLLRRTIAAIREASGEHTPLLLVGGRPFLDDPRLVDIVGADLCARDAAEAAALLRERFP